MSHLRTDSAATIQSNATTRSNSTFFVRALYPFSGVDTASLSFRQGDVIEVLSTLESGWWDGIIISDKIRGWFPSNYVERVSDDEAAWAREQMTEWWEQDSEDDAQSYDHDETADAARRALDDMLADGTATASFADTVSFSSGGDIFREIADADLSAPTLSRQSSSAVPSGMGATSREEEPPRAQGGDVHEEGLVVPERDGASLASGKTDETVDGIVPATARLQVQTDALVRPPRRSSLYSIDSPAPDLLSPTSAVASTSASAPSRPRLSMDTGGVLEAPPPPFIGDLENSVQDALQLLSSTVGITPPRPEECNDYADFDAWEHRRQLAHSVEAVTVATRNLLTCLGALDSLTTVSSAAALPTPPGLVAAAAAPPTVWTAELRPASRRVTTALSKLLLSLRAVWGLLETTLRDHREDADFWDDDASEAERERMQQELALHRSQVRSWRRQVEMRARAEAITETGSVRSAVTAFVGEYERAVANAAGGDLAGGVRGLRAPRPLTGGLKTNATALFLPGGGYGGNWRGNGFVTLPTPHSSPQPDAKVDSRRSLSYAYPMQPLGDDIAQALALQSTAVLEACDALVDPTSASRLLKLLGDFLAIIEDIDIAAGIDAAEEDVRVLLADFETAKQGLYDASPALVLAVQGALEGEPAEPVLDQGPQPWGTSPLSSRGPYVELDPDVDTEAVSALGESIKGNVDDMCRLIAALAKVADPQHARRLADGGSASTSSAPRSFPARMSASGISISPASSRVSLPQPDSRDISRAPTRAGDEEDKPGKSLRKAFTNPFASPEISNAFASLTGRRGSTTPSIAPSIASSKDSDSLQYAEESEHSVTKRPSNKKLAQILGSNDRSGSLAGSFTSSDGGLPSPIAAAATATDYVADEVTFTPEGYARGGTLRALVIAATSHEGRVDGTFLAAFLMTYRTFCTSRELLEQLVDRWNIQPPTHLGPEAIEIWHTRKQKLVRARVANLLKTWLREYVEEDRELWRQIAAFANEQLGADERQQKQILSLIDDRFTGVLPRSTVSLAQVPRPAPILPRNMKKLKLLDLDPTELARQLTIMASGLYLKITPQECLCKAWPKLFGSSAPVISRIAELGTGVTRWVQDCILAQDELKKRAAVIKHFILIADKCMSLNNFETLLQIVAGLNASAILRLKRTWLNVSAKSAVQLEAMNKLMQAEKNRKAYRELLRNTAPPCVPFVGMYMTDLVFIGDGNADYLKDRPHQINFSKRQKASDVILTIKLHQTTAYNLAPVPQLANWLEQQIYSPEGLSERELQRLFNLSLEREPRERDDEKIARLLSESGFL